MTFEFDHLFILTDIGASEANRLSSFGLVEGASRIHRGQGTANRCFFFHNAMLELLWIHDPEEAKSEPIHQTRLWERSTNRNNGACPFGICLRPAKGSEDIVAFSSWAYRPPYLQHILCICSTHNFLAIKVRIPVNLQVLSNMKQIRTRRINTTQYSWQCTL